MAEPSDPNNLPQLKRTGAFQTTDSLPAEAPSGTIAQVSPSLAALASAPFHLQIPGYEVLGELGRGGMGAVFKGRDLELGRDLAIKVLLEGRQDDAGTVQRFLEEAQIGGQLQHPGVVPVHEVGRLSDDRPYFTMKLVEGHTLAALLKDRNSPADDLPRFLKIFDQICQTLAYAHTRGVIHRDLKPLNIMVGAFGEVQVMDWGLAKVMKGGGVRTARSGESDSETTAGSIFGTPAYMAPEQACGDVEGLDERCDVFGLGAMLCEILTGAPAYQSREKGSLLRQAARADLTDAFVRLDACGADAELVRLAKACLAAEPADRPRNGGAVAEGMAGYLAGVQERLRTAEMERAAAQARVKEERKRRRLTVALAATVLLATAAAGAGALWYQHEQSLRATELARKASATELDVTAALDEAAMLGAQARKLKNDPAKWEAALGEALSAVKRAEGVLNAGVATNELLGRVDAARAELEAADKDRRMIARLEEAQMQQAEAGKDGFDNAGSAALYASAFEQDMGLAALTPEAAAERINRRVIREELLAALADWFNITSNKADEQRLRVLLKAADPDPASFRNRVNAFTAQKDWDALRKLALSPESLNQPPAQLQDLGRQLRAADGVPFLRRANERHPSDFWITLQLALACQKIKPLPATDEAIRYYTAAIALRPGSAVVHNNLGHVLRDKGRLDEATAEFRKALELKADFANPHLGLGNVFHDKGQRDDAISEFRKALDVKQDYADAHCNLGQTLFDNERADEAITELQIAIKLKPEFPAPHNNLGNVLRGQRRFDEADAQFREALKLDGDLPESHLGLGNVLSDKGHWDDAINEYRKALELKHDCFEAHFNIGVVLSDNGRSDDAIAEYRKALELKPDYAEAHLGIANILHGKGRLDEAISEYQTAIKTKPEITLAYYNLALALKQQGRFTESLDAYKRAQQAAAKDPHWRIPSADWVGAAEELVRLDALLPALLKREAEPSSPTVAVQFAKVCNYKGRFEDSVRFFRQAFAADPASAENLNSGNRYDAACVAALGGSGMRADAKAIEDKDRARLRKQALDWLRADLALATKKVGADPQDREFARQILQHWRIDPDLAGVRDNDAVAKLPPDEQDAWRKLWSDVAVLLKKAEAPLPTK